MLLLVFQSSALLLIAIQNGEMVAGSAFLLTAAETARRSGVFVGMWRCGRVLFVFEWKGRSDP